MHGIKRYPIGLRLLSLVVWLALPFTFTACSDELPDGPDRPMSTLALTFDQIVLEEPTGEDPEAFDAYVKSLRLLLFHDGTVENLFYGANELSQFTINADGQLVITDIFVPQSQYVVYAIANECAMNSADATGQEEATYLKDFKGTTADLEAITVAARASYTPSASSPILMSSAATPITIAAASANLTVDLYRALAKVEVEVYDGKEATEPMTEGYAYTLSISELANSFYLIPTIGTDGNATRKNVSDSQTGQTFSKSYPEASSPADPAEADTPLYLPESKGDVIKVDLKVTIEDKEYSISEENHEWMAELTKAIARNDRVVIKARRVETPLEPYCLMLSVSVKPWEAVVLNNTFE